MTKSYTIGVILLIVISFGVGCGEAGAEMPPPAPPATDRLPLPSETVTPPTPTPEPPLDPVLVRLGEMSTQEKIGQLLVAGIDGYQAGEDGRIAIEDYRVGGIILFGRNVENAPQLATLTNELKELNGDYVNLFMAVDEEGGRVSRMPGEVTDLPSPYRYIQEGGDPSARGAVLAEACKTFGFNLNFAPSLDIWTNLQNMVIGDRAFSNHWEQVADAGEKCTFAMMDAGVVPVVKHFPGHGDTVTDSHVGLPVVGKTVEELLQGELIPFQRVIGSPSDEGHEPVPAVMVAHILMTEIDGDYPASLSPKVVNGLLRERLGFGGMVVTDDLTMGAVSNTYGMGEAAVLAVEAGCDLLLVCHKTENLAAAYEGLLAAVESGRLSVARLEESVERILRVKEAFPTDGEAANAPDVAALNEKIGAILP